MAKAAEPKAGYRKVSVASLEPNPWNPNKMPGALFTKLVKNIEETLKKQKKGVSGEGLPPVVVRPHPTDKDKFQIIDGFHRYKAHKQLKLPDIDAFVMNVDDETAKLLTMNLNYLRGEKDPEKYTSLLSDLLEGGLTVDALGDLLPEDGADISDLITTYGDGAAIRRLIEATDESSAKEAVDALADDHVFVELKFNVSVSQAKVIQKEVDRIGKALVGNNVEGRALEFMAVQSSQTELPPELVEQAKKEPPKKSGLDSLKERAKAKLKKLKETAS